MHFIVSISVERVPKILSCIIVSRVSLVALSLISSLEVPRHLLNTRITGSPKRIKLCKVHQQPLGRTSLQYLLHVKSTVFSICFFVKLCRIVCCGFY